MLSKSLNILERSNLYISYKNGLRLWSWYILTEMKLFFVEDYFQIIFEKIQVNIAKLLKTQQNTWKLNFNYKNE